MRATEDAIAALADRSRPITVADIVGLQHAIEPSLAPGLRDEQNWVGGPGWSPLRAEFVPPPETEVPRLVADLARFVTETTGNPVVRAAIAHAQFETIHPFVDGNGRTGRALIHVVLRRADALRNILIPISTVFAGDTSAYIAGLTAFRADPPQLDDWVIAFAQATERAAGNAVRLSADVAALDERDSRGAHRLPPVSRPDPRGPATRRRHRPHPRRARDRPRPHRRVRRPKHGVSNTAAHNALIELADAGILGRTKDQRGRLICWTADRHLALVALTERSNRVGAGDTAGRRPKQGPPLPEIGQYGHLQYRTRRRTQPNLDGFDVPPGAPVPQMVIQP